MDTDELHTHDMEAEAALSSGRRLLSRQDERIAAALMLALKNGQRIQVSPRKVRRFIDVIELPGDWAPQLVRDPLRRTHFICIPFWSFKLMRCSAAEYNHANQRQQTSH